jgi:hypothetical protein
MIEQLFVQFDGLVFQQTIGMRPMHVPIDMMTLDMHNNVMMVNWSQNDNTDIHDGLSTLSFTSVIVSSEQCQDGPR